MHPNKYRDGERCILYTGVFGGRVAFDKEDEAAISMRTSCAYPCTSGRDVTLSFGIPSRVYAMGLVFWACTAAAAAAAGLTKFCTFK